jgi:hypothetical protein
MWASMRRLAIGLLVGETDLAIWRLWLLHALLVLAPAIAFARIGVDPPLLLRVVFVPLPAALVGSRSIALESGRRWLVSMYVSGLPLIVVFEPGNYSVLGGFLVMGSSFGAFHAGAMSARSPLDLDDPD